MLEWMVAVNSTMVALGMEAPNFNLLSVSGEKVDLSKLEAKAFLIIFMCNHCPYVIHIQDILSDLAKEYMEKGVSVMGINSNDAGAYPEDSFENMKTTADGLGYVFPYLYDESQAVAKAYGAACTPDVYIFDANKKLVYRGQFDDSRPGGDIECDGRSVRKALDAILSGLSVSDEQKPSMGCNIKWKPGNAPSYFRL